MKRFIRGIALILSLTMLIPLFSGCNQDNETYYKTTADEYNDEREVLDNISNLMLQAVTSGVGAGAKEVGTSVASWVAKGILNALGFDYGQDQTLTYVKECLQKLDNITGSIEDIQGQLNDIEKLSVDNKYMQVFTYFQNRYDALLSDASTAYKTFFEMDRQSKGNPTSDNMEKLCADFANMLDTRYSDLESKVLQLGYALMGNTSAASATTKYSIMDTMTYFAESETPFRNQRYAIENSVLVPSMTLYDYGHQMVL